MYVGVEINFRRYLKSKIWSEEIRNKSKFIEWFIKGNAGISYSLGMVYKVESRLGINRNSDQYTVLNWTKSGIESLYNNSHTIYTVVFSVLLLFFYFFFFFSSPVGGPVPYFRAHTRLFRVAKGNYWDRSARAQDEHPRVWLF